MHQKILKCYGSIDHAPHHELLIATHGLALELMISCALPPDITSSWRPFLVRKKEGEKEIRIFKGLIDIFLLEEPPLEEPNEVLIACEMAISIAKAIRLRDFSARIRRFADVEEIGVKTRITVQGIRGLIRLQGSMGKFFRQTSPHFNLPFGLDTEIYTRPQKFERLGFKKVVAV